MYTPDIALVWEFWRRHRTRIIALSGLLLAFIFIYPQLCALAGINPTADGLDALARHPALQHHEGPMLTKIIQVLYLLFLSTGPTIVMILSLLLVIWMFTCCQFDPQTRDPLKFPARLFLLPVSTSFLFWRLALAGMVTLAALYEGWIHLVAMPPLDTPILHKSVWIWLTFLVASQGVVWALAAWPATRMIVLTVMLFNFLMSPSPDWPDVFRQPLVLPLGLVLGYAGLKKMRHGQWQGITWRPAGRAGLTGPARFSSPAQAQLWFEWRRTARGLCLMVAAVVLVGLIICLTGHFVYGWPHDRTGLPGILFCLASVPPLLHFTFGAAPARTDQPFLMVRPMTSGEMVMSMLKAFGISAILTWLMVLAACGVLSTMGSLRDPDWDLSTAGWVAFFFAAMLGTWRSAVVNLCFALPGVKRIANVPAFLICPVIMLGIGLHWLSQNDIYWSLFLQFLPALLLFLTLIKFAFASYAFGASVKRRLLDRQAVANYLLIWAGLVAVLDGAALTVIHPAGQWLFSLFLGAVLLAPLGRIGLAPMALARFRHA